MYYSYDIDGTLISFYYDNDISVLNDGEEYYYIRDLQGNITRVVDKDGEIVVEYVYDSWGSIINWEDISTNDIANINPYTYRGYRLDYETGYYYLQSRYYNPSIGRFISSDGILGEVGNIKSNNMYAYCANNPVMFTDSTGMSPKTWMIISSLVLITLGVIFIGAGGRILVSAGAGSLIEGFINESLGGGFEAEWVGGLISGTLL
ncbi:MAG: RHS repeat-associated core domain-containing protein, partial [Candidatus Izemoplasmatales bacterium]|nr:RHS repeat-associated core domain-containing protein [Candidatus Izemoplasmatales bacterium]